MRYTNRCLPLPLPLISILYRLLVAMLMYIVQRAYFSTHWSLSVKCNDISYVPYQTLHTLEDSSKLIVLA